MKGWLIVDNSIQVQDLVVRARGRPILASITACFADGQVTGLIGKNGAGKSTLLKAVVGIIRPDAERITFGQADGPAPHLGFLPEYLGFVEHLDGLRKLRLLRSLGQGAVTEPLESLLDRVGLDSRDRRPVSAYSQGMRRRLGIAQAIMEVPPIVVFDEPTNGLDPDGIRWFRQLARDLSTSGTTVVISSHLLGELELSCDHMVMLHDGEVVHQGPRRSLTQYVRRLRVRVEDGDSAARLEQLFSVHLQADLEYEVEITDGPATAIKHLVGAGIRLYSVSPTATALEDLFVELSA